MKLTLIALIGLLVLAACDKTIHEARLRVDQPITLSNVSQSGLTYSAPNN